MDMEQRRSPPPASWASEEHSRSLTSTHRGRHERSRSYHAETKQPSNTTQAAKRWVSSAPPLPSAQPKRPLLPPPGLPSLTSPSGAQLLSRPAPPQRHPSTATTHDRDASRLTHSGGTPPLVVTSGSGSSCSSGRPPSLAGSGDSDSLALGARHNALQCVDHASRRQAAAQAALAATSQLASSLTTLVAAARQSRIDAEHATARAEGAAKKVEDASHLAAKDKQRASLELDEANAQAEEAWAFLRRANGASAGRKMRGAKPKASAETCVEACEASYTTLDLPDLSPPRRNQAEEALKFHRRAKGASRWPTERDAKPKAKTENAALARVGTELEVCEESYATLNLPALSSPRRKAGRSLTRAEIKKQKSQHGGGGSASSESSSNQESVLEPLRKFKGHTSPVTQIAAVDQTRFISSSWDTTVRLWNAETGACLRTFRGHSDWVHAISVLDCNRFISGSDDRTVKLWDFSAEECLQTFTGHSSFVKCLAPIGKERFLSGSRDRTVKLFAVTGGDCLRTFEGHGAVVSALVALDSHHFASGSHDSSIKYWKDSSGTCVRTLVGHTGSIKTLAAISETDILSGADDKTVRLWNVATGACLRTFGSQNSLVFSVTHVCEGFFLLCGGNNIRLYHVASGKCVKSYQTPRISLAVVRLDDELFVTGSDQMLHLWKF